MIRDKTPPHIKSVDELKTFPINVLDQELPWNYRTIACCLGIVARPVLFVLGQGRFLKELHDGQKEELRVMLNTMKDDEEWTKLDIHQQLDFRIRATNLTNQFLVNRITSGKK